MSLSSFSGDIGAEEIHCQSISLRTKSGDIEAKRIYAQSMVAETMSGDVKYKHVQTHVFTCNTTSGDFRGKYLDSRSVYAKTVSGDGKLHLDCQGEPCYACTKTVSGDMKVKGAVKVSSLEFQNIRAEEGRKVFLSSVSGDGSIKVSKETE